jgi:hypothetical protein
LRLSLTVKQGWWRWRDEGTVTLAGTGDPRIDGQALEGRFVFRRFSAGRGDTNALSCDGRHRVEVSLDLASGTPGKLTFEEGKYRRCDPRPACIGDLELELVVQAHGGGRQP